MKIIYISNSIIPSVLANSVHVMKMCEAFAKNGNQVVLYCIKSSSFETDLFDYYGVSKTFELVRLKRFNIKVIGNLIYAFMLYHRIKRLYSDADILYSRELHGIYLLRKNKKFIYEAHTLPKKRLDRFLTYKILKSRMIQKIIVISEALKKDYLSRYKFLKSTDVLVAHDGANIPNLDFDIDQNNHKTIEIGYIGHLYAGRGIDLIVKLAERIQNHNFHVIGGRENDVNDWRNQTTKIKNIYFHGHIPNGKLGSYYKKLDIMLAPYESKVSVLSGVDTSRWMSPMKIFEYMSYAKAIIATDLPVLREILNHDENAILCPPGDLDAWEAALQKLINDVDHRNFIRFNAFNCLIKNYTWVNRAKRVLD